MDGEILIAFAFLETLEHHARTAADALDGASQMMTLEFTGNPEITDAYADFLGRWDEHRGSVRDGITVVADTLRVVREAFTQVEDQLVAALNGPG